MTSVLRTLALSSSPHSINSTDELAVTGMCEWMCELYESDYCERMCFCGVWLFKGIFPSCCSSVVLAQTDDGSIRTERILRP